VSDAVVREAGPADVPALAGLRAAWEAETGGGAGQAGAADTGGFVDAFRAWYEAEAGRRRFWLAERAGRPVGMVNLAVFDRMPKPGRPAGGWGYLNNMVVRPEQRDAGIGSRLVGAVLAWADATGLERVVLHPSERSVPFYRRHGFVPAVDLMLRWRD
jgi:GNAT superfamily N-acetyltransferase